MYMYRYAPGENVHSSVPVLIAMQMENSVIT